MTFSATLTPPTGITVPSVMQGVSGATYSSGSGQVTVTDETDYRALVRQDWTVVSISVTPG